MAPAMAPSVEWCATERLAAFYNAHSVARGLLPAMAAAVVRTAALATTRRRGDMDRESDPGSIGSPTGPESIREMRAKLGLTQEEFAHAIAVTVSTVNRWENGHATPSKLAWRSIQGLMKKRSGSAR